MSKLGGNVEVTERSDYIFKIKFRHFWCRWWCPGLWITINFFADPDQALQKCVKNCLMKSLLWLNLSDPTIGVLLPFQLFFLCEILIKLQVLTISSIFSVFFFPGSGSRRETKFGSRSTALMEIVTLRKFVWLRWWLSPEMKITCGKGGVKVQVINRTLLSGEHIDTLRNNNNNNNYSIYT